jgi:hypothetical protein
MSTRNAVYKMSGLKFASSAKARAQRIDEQNGNRRTARYLNLHLFILIYLTSF